jgi:hypothetical protein
MARTKTTMMKAKTAGKPRTIRQRKVGDVPKIVAVKDSKRRSASAVKSSGKTSKFRAPPPQKKRVKRTPAVDDTVGEEEDIQQA